jgi:hypothetical protein
MSFLYDTHVHTAETSRCARATAKEQVRFYKSKGFDGIVITDHFLGGNTTVPDDLPWEKRVNMFFRGYENALEEGVRLGLKVFFGWEHTHIGADFLTYGLNKAWLLENKGLDVTDINSYLDHVRAQGAYVVHAHPFREDFYIPMIQLMPRQVDAVEIINSCRTDFENEMAAQYAKNYGLQAFAGSDNHVADKQKRLSGIETETELNSIEALISIVRAGKYRLFDYK